LQTIAENTWYELSSRLKQFIGSKVSDRNDAEDLLQDVFLKLHRHADALESEEKVQSWMYRVTRNAIIDYYRTRKQNVPFDETFHHNGDTEPDDAFTTLATGMQALVRLLPEPYRQALELTEFGGMTQKELAEHQGISLSGAKSRVQRARKKVKQMLLECCHFEFDRLGKVIHYEPRCACCKQC